MIIDFYDLLVSWLDIRYFVLIRSFAFMGIMDSRRRAQ